MALGPGSGRPVGNKDINFSFWAPFLSYFDFVELAVASWDLMLGFHLLGSFCVKRKYKNNCERSKLAESNELLFSRQESTMRSQMNSIKIFSHIYICFKTKKVTMLVTNKKRTKKKEKK